MESNKEIEAEAEFTKNVILVQQEIKGYKFTCVGKFHDNLCGYCGKQFVNFVTMDVEEAYKHSRDNNMPMWIVNQK